PRLCAYRFRSFCLSHRKAGRVPRRNTPLEIKEAHAPRDAGLSDEGAGGPADPPCPAVARHTRTRSRAPQAYGSSDPTAPAVPRATFAAHPSLRVRWGQYAPAGIDGDKYRQSAAGHPNRLSPTVSFPRKRESLFAGLTSSTLG